MGALISFAEFLAKSPPGNEKEVANLLHQIRAPSSSAVLSTVLNTPDVRIHCPSLECNGERAFECLFPQELKVSLHGGRDYAWLKLLCRNCRSFIKTIAIRFECSTHGSLDGKALKIGEDPPFGPPVPSRAVTLVGPDRDAFLKGRRSENQGFGIGAFAYYRRVIENQKDRIFDEIIRAATRLNADATVIEELEMAKNGTQFSKAIEAVKHGLPPQLLINGYNPLTLLHSALSEGLHAMTDDKCLELATAIREVLFEFAERIGGILKEQSELDAAVNRLAQRNN